VMRRYLARLSECGIDDGFFLLVGVAALASARSARWIVSSLKGSIIPQWIIERLDRASDPKAEGEAICVEVLGEMREIPGLAGVHIMAPMNDAAIPRVIAKLRA